jgi:hypothetical protein
MFIYLSLTITSGEGPTTIIILQAREVRSKLRSHIYKEKKLGFKLVLLKAQIYFSKAVLIYTL